MTTSMASKLESVYVRYVVEGKVSPRNLSLAGIDKLYCAIALIKEGNHEDVVQTAISLRRDDLRREVKHDDCIHDTLLEERFARCAKCGKFARV